MIDALIIEKKAIIPSHVGVGEPKSEPKEEAQRKPIAVWTTTTTATTLTTWLIENVVQQQGGAGSTTLTSDHIVYVPQDPPVSCSTRGVMVHKPYDW